MSEATINEDSLPTTSEQLFNILKELDIDYELYHHEAIFTVEEGKHLKKGIPGQHCRNLFLRDKKKNMFLVVMANETKIDLKDLPDLIGAKRLSFGSADRLWQYLGIRQGSVNPFCVLNDADREVKMVLDKHMMDSDLVNFHPMDNAMTIGISPKDLVRFIESTGHSYQTVDLRN